MKMKTLILLLFIFPLTFPILAAAQDARKSTIKQEVKRINNDSTLVTILLENDDFQKESSDGGGRLTGYYKGNQLVKIVRWTGLSHGVEIVEFYFKKSRLLFVYEQFDTFFYDAKIDSVRYDSTERNFEGRYWFDNGKFFDSLTMGHNRFENDALDPGVVWTGEANELKAVLEKRRRNNEPGL